MAHVFDQDDLIDSVLDNELPKHESVFDLQYVRSASNCGDSPDLQCSQGRQILFLGLSQNPFKALMGSNKNGTNATLSVERPTGRTLSYQFAPCMIEERRS